MNDFIRHIINEILSALKHVPPLPVNLGRHRHGLLVPTLHRFVYGEDHSEKTLKKLRVTFTDGSETKPFPLICLTPPAEPDPRKYVLRVGLNSGRHPELDRSIEFYLFRNREVNQWEGSAEQEEEAFLHSMEFLQDPFWKDGGVVEMYQTGLEPLVIGFYRAVVEVARMRRKHTLPPLTVVPKIFRPARLSVNHFLVERMKQANMLLKPEQARNLLSRIEQALEKVTTELDDFLALRKESERLFLLWLPQRPMWTEEKDYLTQRFPSVKHLFSALYEKSQYPNLQNWG